MKINVKKEKKEKKNMACLRSSSIECYRLSIGVNNCSIVPSR